MSISKYTTIRYSINDFDITLSPSPHRLLAVLTKAEGKKNLKISLFPLSYQERGVRG
jgi:hypothetical protein